MSDDSSSDGDSILVITRGPSNDDDSSDEYSSQEEFVPKRKKTARQLDTPPEVNTNSDEGDNNCSICLDDFVNYGKHRPASLLCGHIFGHCCIERWLTHNKRKVCPTCNKKAKLRDIRIIYTRNLKVLDTAERDRALEELETVRKENQALENAQKQLRLSHSMALEEIKRLREELDRVSNLKHQVETELPSTSSKHTRFILEKSLPLSKKSGSRVLVFDNHFQCLIASTPCDYLNIGGFGVKKYTASSNFSSSETVKIHDAMIRCMKMASNNVLISGGMDRKLCMTSTNSNTIVQKWECPAAIWACDVSLDDSTKIFTGLSNGTVLVYDIRSTKEAVETLERPESLCPIISLTYLSAKPSSSFYPAGLLVGSLDGAFFFENSQGSWKHHSLLSGSCTNVSVDSTTRLMLSSFRPSRSVTAARHIVTELSASSCSENLSIQSNALHTFYGGSVMRIMSRNTFITSSNSVKAAIFDEASESIGIWDCTTGNRTQQIRTGECLYEICPFTTTSGTHYLAGLGDSSVKLLKSV